MSPHLILIVFILSILVLLTAGCANNTVSVLDDTDCSIFVNEGFSGEFMYTSESCQVNLVSKE